MATPKAKARKAPTVRKALKVVEQTREEAAEDFIRDASLDLVQPPDINDLERRLARIEEHLLKHFGEI